MARQAPPLGAEDPPRFEGAPHDGLFRYAFRRPEHAAAALRTLLPLALVAHLDLENLQRIDPVTNSDRLGERRCDLIFEARLTGRPVLLQFIFEHQSKVDRDMALRLLRAMAELWTDWRRRHPSGALPAIVPCVLYHGERRWTAPRDLQSLLDLGDTPEVTNALRPLLPQFRYLLDDLNRTPEAALTARPWPPLPKLAVLLLKFARPDADLSAIVPRWSEHVRALVSDPDRDAWSALVRYILTATVTPAADLADHLAGHLPTEAQEEIMSTADQLIAQGHARGHLEAAQIFLKRMLRLRFGPTLPPEVLDRIDAAGVDAIDRWADRVATAPSALAAVND